MTLLIRKQTIMRPVSNTHRRTYSLAVCCLSLVLVADRGEGEEPSKIPPTKPSGNAEFDRLVQESEKLLSENASLETILKHPDKSVAATACWAYYNSPKLHGQLIDYHQLMKARKRFLGYLSTTIEQFPPEWWEESLIKESLKFNDSSLKEYRYHTVVEQDTDILKYDDRYYRNELNLYGKLCLPQSAKVTEFEQNGYLLQIEGDVEIQMSSVFWNELKKLYGAVKVVVLEEGCVLLVYRIDRARGISAYRIDQTGNLKWKAELWGTGLARSDEDHQLGRSGEWEEWVHEVHDFHYLEVVTNEEQLVVFGADFSGAYMEMFDLESGEDLLRFSTSYLK